MEKDVKEFSTATEKLIQVDIEKEMRESFLQYSMAVLVSRALPDVRDGMKPVHRRIIYTMNEADNTSSKPYRKCAYTVGEVLGKYHPHGDASVYDALVRLAQDFSMRYPLIDGHGNFGSVDGDPPAAYRYTEARMAKIASELLKDIKKDTIDWGKNYDDKLDEPTVLPVKFPNLLVNGSVGIAVGMATNIPPHNLNEVCDAIVARMDNPECGIEEILQYIKGPDFPTGGIIMGYSGIRSAYYTGRGKITLRGKAEIVEEGNHSRIIVTEIPYMVNKSKLLETTGQLMRDKRIEGISNLRDESDKDGMRIVYELKRDVNAQVVLNKLYSFTQLQDTVGVIMIALVNGEPKQLTLLEILDNYIAFQKQIITRRTAFDLKKARERAHILQGFLLAIDNIDEVISILRSSKSVQEGKERLMERFKEDDLAKLLQRAMGENYKDVHFEHEIGLSEEQADAIVQMRLGQLTGLERDKVISELAEIMEKINDFLDILSSDERVKEIIKEEITAIKEKYGDERRTAIGYDVYDLSTEDLIPRENTVITMTKLGYIKRMTVDNFRSQNRGGRGIKGMQTIDDDYIEELLMTTTHHYLMFFTNTGRVYRLKAYEIPEAGRTARGTAIVNLLQLMPGERITSVIPMRKFEEGKYLVMATKAGLVKKTPMEEYANVRKTGLVAITLRDDDELIEVKATDDTKDIMLVTKDGMCIRFKETDVRSTGRSSMGVRGMNLDPGDEVVAMQLNSQGDYLLVVSENGMGKRTAMSEFTCQNRGGKGVKCYKITEKTGNVIGAKAVNEENEIMMITTEGIIIRITCAGISILGRITSGVKLINLDEGVTVASLAKVREKAEGNTENGSSEEPTEETEEVFEEEDSQDTNDAE